jgi:hypothetical protein
MSSVRIQILSDLHLENPAAYDLFEIPPAAPNLALLGDIGHAKDDGLFIFLRRQLENFQTVFFLLGNHEPYHSSHPAARNRLREFQLAIDNERTKDAEKSLGRFIFLERTRFDISPTVTILGCTLFSHIQPPQRDYVSFGLNDFYHITDWTVDDHNHEHAADVAWLNEQVHHLMTTEPERKIVVLTHYSPTIDQRSISPAHTKSNISSGFMTDLSSTGCWTAGNVKVWAFGHTHFNCDYVDEQTGKRVLANQRGYYFSQADGMDIAKVIEI